jgi:hypothetical protein
MYKYIYKCIDVYSTIQGLLWQLKNYKNIYVEIIVNVILNSNMMFIVLSVLDQTDSH